MALGSLLDALLSVLDVPFPHRRPKSRQDKMDNAFAIIFWLLMLAAALLGLASLAK